MKNRKFIQKKINNIKYLFFLRRSTFLWFTTFLLFLLLLHVLLIENRFFLKKKTFLSHWIIVFYCYSLASMVWGEQRKVYFIYFLLKLKRTTMYHGIKISSNIIWRINIRRKQRTNKLWQYTDICLACCCCWWWWY